MGHQVLTLYDYHVWANGRVFHHLRTLPEVVYHQQLTSVFPSIADTLAHIYVADSMWLSVMSGDAFDKTAQIIQRSQNESRGISLEQMEGLFAGMAGAYRTFLHEQDDLDRPIAPEHPRHGRLETRLSELVRHVVNHGTYHRGMITAMFRQQGYAGVATDYAFFLRERGSGGGAAGGAPA